MADKSRALAIRPSLSSRTGLAKGGLGVMSALLCGSTALAGPLDGIQLAPHEMAALGLHVGIVCAAVLTGIAFLRARKNAYLDAVTSRNQLADLRLKLDRAAALLTFEPQVIVTWGGASGEAEIETTQNALPTLSPDQRILAFGSWLPPDQAQSLERAVQALRERGSPFQMNLLAHGTIAVEAQGQPISGRAVLRLRIVSGLAEKLMQIDREHQHLKNVSADMSAFLSALPMPVWLRNAEGRLSWANQAFAAAMNAPSRELALADNADFLDQSDREAVSEARKERQGFSRRISASTAGQRRVFDFHDLPLVSGSGSIAIDVTETETIRASLRQEMEAHKRTLDQLETAVAIFDHSRTLIFSNTAYAQLWALPATFIDSQPTDDEVLDRLRQLGRLPVESDYKGWKAKLHQAYSTPVIEPRRDIWHLPDGRALAVVQSPDETGGLTYLFEDVTERYRLESRMTRLNQVQRETLDNLEEAVAVFGSDGRLSLYNTAFTTLWAITDADLADRPHIERVSRLCKPLCTDEQVWNTLMSRIVSLSDKREAYQARMERTNSTVLDLAAAPLPDGATLLTFRNVTASVQMQRALAERNEALETTSRIKSDFVENVSYQLRTPLTSIIGFSQVLDDPSVGPLNERQRDYLGYITASSAALLALINDILDLATIDAGAMSLDVQDIDIASTMQAAAEGIRDRLTTENGLRLLITCADDIGTFQADGTRVRQVLFNLLSNAIAFSHKDGTIRLSAVREGGDVVFHVVDDGAGIPDDLKARVFERFEAKRAPSRHRGAGLGLSIVRSFVELHRGQIEIDSTEGKGTRVTVRLPARQMANRDAAE